MGDCTACGGGSCRCWRPHRIRMEIAADDDDDDDDDVASICNDGNCSHLRSYFIQRIPVSFIMLKIIRLYLYHIKHIPKMCNFIQCRYKT